MSMYLGWIHVRASLPVSYGLLYWPSSVGCMLSPSGKCVPTKNSMRYVRYGALKDRTVQQLPKHCVYHSSNTFIQPTNKIYY